MLVSDFDFDLPPERIALRPAVPRDSARLLEVRGASMSDHIFRDLPSRLAPGDVLVINDTRVIPAQLHGQRGEARIGVTLHKREGLKLWWSFVKNARRLKIGDVVSFGEALSRLRRHAAARWAPHRPPTPRMTLLPRWSQGARAGWRAWCGPRERGVHARRLDRHRAAAQRLQRATELWRLQVCFSGGARPEAHPNCRAGERRERLPSAGPWPGGAASRL